MSCIKCYWLSGPSFYILVGLGPREGFRALVPPPSNSWALFAVPEAGPVRHRFALARPIQVALFPALSTPLVESEALMPTEDFLFYVL